MNGELEDYFKEISLREFSGSFYDTSVDGLIRKMGGNRSQQYGVLVYITNPSHQIKGHHHKASTTTVPPLTPIPQFNPINHPYT